MRHSRRVAICLNLLLLSACGGPPYRYTERLAHEQTRTVAIPLGFVPASEALEPQDYPVLLALRSDLGPDAAVKLVAEGPRASARAAAVSAFLGRTVDLAPPIAPGTLEANRATLEVAETRLVADACERPGVAVGMNLWPGDDATRQRLMPPGCATAQTLLRQAVNPADVLRGEPLAPAAAGPYVQAILRYYERNNATSPTQHGTAAGVSSPGYSAGSSGLSAMGSLSSYQ